MGIIEQAAKRLQQLKQAGIETDPVGAEAHQSPSTDSVPLRVAKELESRTGAPARAEPHLVLAEHEARQPAETIRPATEVTVDLARLSANGYITPHAERSRVAEEFRVIKRPLLNNAAGKSAAAVRNANRIMVTSALPGEGKTFVSVNLAMSIAMELDTQVLLVDADATRPAVMERLGIPPSRGLLDLLVDPRLPLDAAVLRTNIDRLHVLPAGTPHTQATELLASEGMSRLVERLASDDSRRIVIFDTPPLLVASESRVLAAHMGQVIMVIAADDTPQGTVAEALATVENCPVVFTLLNRVAGSERGHYYGSYSAYAH